MKTRRLQDVALKSKIIFILVEQCKHKSCCSDCVQLKIFIVNCLNKDKFKQYELKQRRICLQGSTSLISSLANSTYELRLLQWTLYPDGIPERSSCERRPQVDHGIDWILVKTVAGRHREILARDLVQILERWVNERYIRCGSLNGSLVLVTVRLCRLLVTCYVLVQL